MMIRRRDVNLSGLKTLAVQGVRYFKQSNVLKNLRKQTRAIRRNVPHDKDGGGKFGRKLRDQIFQCLKTAGGRADDDYVSIIH